MKTLIFCSVLAVSFSVFGAWDPTEAVIATKILKKSDRHSYEALGMVEDSVKLDGNGLGGIESIKILYPPGQGDKPMTEIGIEIVGISIPIGQMANNLYGISDEARNSMYSRMENLKELYNSPSASPKQKELIEGYFKDYFNIDLSQDPDAILNNKDTDLVDLQGQSDLFDHQTSNLKEHITSTTWTAAQQVASETKTTIDEVADVLKKRLEKEAAEIEGAIADANAQTQAGLGKANDSLNYLIDRQKERELNEKIAGITNYDKMQEVIDSAKACETGESTASDCKFLVGRVEELEDRKAFLVRKDAFAATAGTLKFMQGLAAVTGDPELAENVNKAMFVVDTAQKITDLALGLGAQTALACMGDVMSMAGLAMTAVSMLSGGGDSADQMILEQLQKIRQQIEDLRKEMHARFDAIELQIKHLGISMNLKFQNTDANIGVVLDNQQYVIKLIEQNSVAIAKLAIVQSNSEAGSVVRELMEASKRIRALENGDELIKEYLRATTSFASFLDYTDVLKLVLPQIDDYSLKSPTAISMVSELTAPLPQLNYANFGLIDYLIRASIQGQLDGDCGMVNFNNLYLFNLIGERLLPVFREEFEDPTLVYPDSNKYMYYLKNGQLSKSGVLEILDNPLNTVDRIVAVADRCLTNYATVDKVKVDLFSYLINEYRRLIKYESDRLLEQTVSGNHMAALNRSVLDPNEAYFADMDKNATNLDITNPGLRGNINLSVVDFKKTLVDNTQTIDDKFYEKYKTVSPCPGADSSNPFGTVTKEEIQANGVFETVTLPQSLLTKVFSQLETRLADTMGLNAPLHICYMPSRLVFDEGDPQLIDMNSIQAFTLFVGFEKYENYKQGTRIFQVPIYVPKTELEFYENFSYDVYAPEQLSDLIGGNSIDSGFQATPEVIDIVFVTNNVVKAPSLNAFFKNKISSYDWECEALPLDTRLNQCWTAGLAPTAAYKQGRLFSYQRPEIVNSEYLKQISREFRVDNFGKNYDLMRNDLLRCYRRMLMGYSQCNFGSYKSFETEEQRVDLTSMNQLNTIIRALAPLVTSFKPKITESERMKYLTNLDLALSPIPQKIMELNTAEGDPLEIIKAEFGELDKELIDLGQQTGKVLQIDTRSLLNTKAYEGLKFYSEETHKFFEAAQ